MNSDIRRFRRYEREARRTELYRLWKYGKHWTELTLRDLWKCRKRKTSK